MDPVSHKLFLVIFGSNWHVRSPLRNMKLWIQVLMAGLTRLPHCKDRVCSTPDSHSLAGRCISHRSNVRSIGSRAHVRCIWMCRQQGHCKEVPPGGPASHIRQALWMFPCLCSRHRNAEAQGDELRGQHSTGYNPDPIQQGWASCWRDWDMEGSGAEISSSSWFLFYF